MRPKKMRVHNLMEVKALIKEAFARGEELEFMNAVWLSHTEQPICVSKIELTEFELILADDGSSLIVEVL